MCETDLTSKCLLKPCLHNSTCIDDMNSKNGYKCQCLPTFEGEHCEKRNNFLFKKKQKQKLI